MHPIDNIILVIYLSVLHKRLGIWWASPTRCTGQHRAFAMPCRAQLNTSTTPNPFTVLAPNLSFSLISISLLKSRNPTFFSTPGSSPAQASYTQLQDAIPHAPQELCRSAATQCFCCSDRRSTAPGFPHRDYRCCVVACGQRQCAQRML